MPKRKERMAGYIRFSDPSMLLDDSTMESQAKAIRLYAEKEGYEYNIAVHEYREAISAYMVPYMERKTLLDALAAAKRREFDVFVVTEIRSLSRRQVEVFIIYDMFQKYGVRLETISEKFEDSAMGRLILSLRSFVAEVERENTYMRMQRGKRDRLEAGNINGHNKAAYGLVFIDTDREVKAAYAINTAIVYVADDIEWTEPMIIQWMCDRCLEGWSCRKIAFQLTEMNVPTPLHNKTIHGKPVSNVWHPSTVYDILTHRIYIGEVIANRYKKVENAKTKKVSMVRRPVEEHVLLPDGTAPPILTRAVFEAVQAQLAVNKKDALRHNKAPKEDIGLLRAGYAKCGICGHTLVVYRRGKTYNGQAQEPQYACCRRFGRDELIYNHNTIITMSVLDKGAIEKIIEVVLDPEQVRDAVTKRQQEVIEPVVNAEDIEATIENIRSQMANLFELAKSARDADGIAALGNMLEGLEKQKREAEAMLLDIDDDDEEREILEAEIVKFELWAQEVRPFLTDPTYLENASYEELRLAIRILGLHAVVFPMHGDYPYRYKIEARPPEIMKHLGKFADCNQLDQSIE